MTSLFRPDVLPNFAHNPYGNLISQRDTSFAHSLNPADPIVPVPRVNRVVPIGSSPSSYNITIPHGSPQQGGLAALRSPPSGSLNSDQAAVAAAAAAMHQLDLNNTVPPSQRPRDDDENSLGSDGEDDFSESPSRMSPAPNMMGLSSPAQHLLSPNDSSGRRRGSSGENSVPPHLRSPPNARPCTLSTIDVSHLNFRAQHLVTRLLRCRCDRETSKMLAKFSAASNGISPAVLQLAELIASNPNTMMTMCVAERGNVMAQVWGAVRDHEVSNRFCDFVLAHFLVLSQDRCGCLALSRFYESASIMQRGLFIRKVSMNIVQLSSDSFGNYFVQHVVKCVCTESSNPATAMYSGIDLLAPVFQRADLVIALLRSKHGSHVVQRFFCEVPLQVLHVILPSLITLTAMEFLQGDYANFVLQALLQRIVRDGDYGLRDYIMSILTPRMGTCPHYRNIMRASGLVPHTTSPGDKHLRTPPKTHQSLY